MGPGKAELELELLTQEIADWKVPLEANENKFNYTVRNCENSSMSFLPVWLKKDIRQIYALTLKDLTLQLRQWKSNVCQLVTPILCMLFILFLQILVDEVILPLVDTSDFVGRHVSSLPMDISTAQFLLGKQNATTPDTILYSTIRNDDDEYIDRIQTGPFVSLEREDAGTRIDEVLYDALEEHAEDPSRIVNPYFGALKVDEFVPVDDNDLVYTVQYEDLPEFDERGHETMKTQFCKDIDTFATGYCEFGISIGMMDYLHSEYIKNATDGYMSVKTYASQQPYYMPAAAIELNLAELMGSFFYPLILLLGIPTIMYSIVLEKETQLKEMMKLMGLKERNYLVSTVMFKLLWYFLSLGLFVVLGLILQHRIFYQTNWFVLMFVFLGIGLQVISTEKKGKNKSDKKIRTPRTTTFEEDEDVKLVRSKIMGGAVGKDDVGILVKGLVKQFGRGRGKNIAVKKVFLDIDKKECFGLLGPNGAGKTTLIRVLSGIFGPNAGTAFLGGYEIRSQLEQIRQRIGLCPQFTIYWPELTPSEHLLFYSRLKGVNPVDEERHVAEILEKVGLNSPLKRFLERHTKKDDNTTTTTRLKKKEELSSTTTTTTEFEGDDDDRKHYSRGKIFCFGFLNRLIRMIFPFEKTAKQMSGGMQRRLAIGISLCGNPDIILLDEPTTGLDATNRREIWDVILKEKMGRPLCMVLTTHSMEEADVLSDRIAIMSHGRVVAIGSSLHLKSKFGNGYSLHVKAESEMVVGRIVEFIEGSFSEICQLKLIKKFGDRLSYQLLPKDDDSGDSSSSTCSTTSNLSGGGGDDHDDVVVDSPEDDDDEEEEEEEERGEMEKGKKREDNSYNNYVASSSLRISGVFEKLEMEKKKLGIVDFELNQTTLEDVFLNVVRLDEEKIINERQQKTNWEELGFENNNNNEEEGEEEEEEEDVEEEEEQQQEEEEEEEEEEGGEEVDKESSSTEQEQEEEESFESPSKSSCSEEEEYNSSSSIDGVEEEEEEEESPLEEEEEEEEEESTIDRLFRSRQLLIKNGWESTKLCFLLLPCFRSCFEGLLQTIFLLQKNCILSCRSWKSSCIQIFSPFVVVLAMFLIFIIVEADRPGWEIHPPIEKVDVSSLQGCVSWMGKSCHVLAYAHNNNVFAKDVMNDVTQRYGLEEGTDYLVFEKTGELERYLSTHENTTQTAISFSNVTTTAGGYLGKTNRTTYTLYFNGTKDLDNQVIPFKIIVDNSILRMSQKWKDGSSVSSSTTDRIRVSRQKFPLIPTYSNVNGQRTVFMFTGPVFFSLLSSILFIVSLYRIVMEKEKGLRKGLEMIGMKKISYVCSWLITFVIFGVIMAIVTMISGYLFQFDVFVYSNPVFMFILFFLFDLSLILLAFAISTFLTKTKSALVVGFVILAISFILNFYIASGTFVYLLLSLEDGFTLIPLFFEIFYPPFNFGKFFSDILNKSMKVYEPEQNKFVPNVGFWGFEDLFEENTSNVFRMEVTVQPAFYSLLFLVLNCIIYTVAFWYFDAVCTDGRNYCFCCFPKFWCCCCGGGGGSSSGCSSRKCRGENGRKMRSRCSLESLFGSLKKGSQNGGSLNEDILKEKETCVEPGEQSFPLRVVGLKKTYRPTLGLGRRTKAVKEVHLHLEKNEIIGLLGPNGAGKSTTIANIAGVVDYDDGEILINEMKRKSSSSQQQQRLRRFLGVTLQENILWDDLTAYEHLRLFCQIKGIITPCGWRKQVKKRLEEVSLYDVRNDCSKTFSGGMKRRLSVALGYVGSPQVILLDEPSTGLDPFSKREVWKLIKDKCKNGDVSTLFTTHSMEECDTLSHRIVIMDEGKFKCIGDSMHLKRKYGAGYVLKISRWIKEEKERGKLKLNCDDEVKKNLFLAFLDSLFPHGKIQKDGGSQYKVCLRSEFTDELIAGIKKIEDNIRMNEKLYNDDDDHHQEEENKTSVHVYHQEEEIKILTHDNNTECVDEDVNTTMFIPTCRLVKNFGLSNTTLEDVYMEVTKKEGKEGENDKNGVEPVVFQDGKEDNDAIVEESDSISSSVEMEEGEEEGLVDEPICDDIELEDVKSEEDIV